MSQTSQHICILGGGFGGLYTALRLSQMSWADLERPTITLIDHSDRFLFSPFLYELMTGELQTWEIAPTYMELLAGTGVQFVQGNVERIDLSQHQVHLADTTTLTYDRLVLALGGETPLDQVPGVAEYALSFRTITDAHRLEERLRQLEAAPTDKIRIAIVGAGPSGVELACKLADRLGERGRLRLIDRHSEILRSATPYNQQAARQALQNRQVWLDLETTPKQVEAHQLSLVYKAQVDTIPVDLVLWTVGTVVAPVIQELPVSHNARGQIVTQPTLQVIDHPEVLALGDLADCRDATGQQVPGTAQVALQQADYAAWNIWASLMGRPLLPFQYTHLGEMLTLGTDSAALSGLGLKLDGPAAYLLRRLVYLYRMPTLEHQLKVGLSWILHPLFQGLQQAAQPPSPH